MPPNSMPLDVVHGVEGRQELDGRQLFDRNDRVCELPFRTMFGIS
jgi:hypothetical protein